VPAGGDHPVTEPPRRSPAALARADQLDAARRDLVAALPAASRRDLEVVRADLDRQVRGLRRHLAQLEELTDLLAGAEAGPDEPTSRVRARMSRRDRERFDRLARRLATSRHLSP
jgi:hypothetical protein